MKIVSLNINGIKAFYNRNEEYALPTLLETTNPDIIAFQETKATEEDTRWWLSEYEQEYDVVACYNHLKKGYAGVAFMIKKGIKCEVIKQEYTGSNIYFPGRIIALEFDTFIIVNVYTLNSGSDKEDYRVEWDSYYINWIKSINPNNKPLILCGDFNVCYEDIDNYNPDAYYDEFPGMYQFERDGMTLLRTELNVSDLWRKRNPEVVKYTWFSYRGGAFYSKHGWRLDYFLVSPDLFTKISNLDILDDLRVSDHHPITLELTDGL